MRNLTGLLNEWRVPIPEILRKEINYAELDERYNGAFVIKYNKSVLRIIASSSGGWDHVSVSLVDRTPTWAEMDYIKRIFFKDDETAMQLHVPVKDHVNVHPFVLHLWRPHSEKIPLPPKTYV